MKDKQLNIRVTKEERERIIELGGASNIIRKFLEGEYVVLNCPYCGTSELLCGYPNKCCVGGDE